MTLGKVCRTIWKKTNDAAVPKTTRPRRRDSPDSTSESWLPMGQNLRATGGR